MEKCEVGGNQRLVGRAVKKTKLGRKSGELSRRMQSAGPCIESLNCKGGSIRLLPQVRNRCLSSGVQRLLPLVDGCRKAAARAMAMVRSVQFFCDLGFVLGRDVLEKGVMVHFIERHRYENRPNDVALLAFVQLGTPNGIRITNDFSFEHADQ